MKICDAGPVDRRTEPIHVTLAIKELAEQRGFVRQLHHPSTNIAWYAPSRSPQDEVEGKLTLLAELYRQTTKDGISNVIGQALEMVILEVLQEMVMRIPGCGYLGSIDTNAHTKTGRYKIFKKQEPPHSISGKTSLKVGDFHLFLPSAGMFLIECKNTREWLYPSDEEIKDTIIKAVEVGLPPILVARKLPYVTREVLCRPSGIIAHASYYQYYPSNISAYCPESPDTLSNIIERAKRKELLGYADIRQHLNARTRKFFIQDLPRIAPDMAAKFRLNSNILYKFAHKEIDLYELRNKFRS